MTNISECQQEKQISSVRRAIPQILAVLVKNILLLGYGMTVGFPTILIPNLSGSDPDEKIILGEDGISWIGSINMIFVPIGCLLSGSITHSFGRRRTMQLVNIPFLLAWLLFHFATETWHVFLALSLTGLTGGLLEAPVITYVAEITEPYIRGALTATSTASINLGILCSYICGTFLPWRQVVLVNCSVPLIATICLCLVPESPYWLIEKNRLNDAQKSIAWLRGWTTTEKVEQEFAELCKTLRNSSTDDSVIETVPTVEHSVPLKKRLSAKETLMLFTQRSSLFPLSTVTLAFFFGHFGGNSNLQVYAVQIFAAINTPIDKYYATILVGVVQLLGVVTCLISIHYLGKRVINFISLSGCIICFTVTGIYIQLLGVHNFTSITNSNINVTSSELQATLEQFSWVPMTLLILSAFLAYVGIKALPWVIMGEIFNNDVRPIATGVSSGIGYILNFFANKCFLTLVGWITLSGVMWFYSGICILALVILYFILPETEGKTLFEISEHYAGRVKLDNKVYKKKKSGVNGKVNKGFALEASKININQREPVS